MEVSKGREDGYRGVSKMSIYMDARTKVGVCTLSRVSCDLHAQLFISIWMQDRGFWFLVYSFFLHHPISATDLMTLMAW